ARQRQDRARRDRRDGDRALRLRAVAAQRDRAVRRLPRARRAEALARERDRPADAGRRGRRARRRRERRLWKPAREGHPLSVLEKVVTLSTGDELTTGKIADTNAQWIADRCVSL